MAIYIRHATDKIDNRKKRYDPSLTHGGAQDAQETCKYLVKLYGLPSKIYCSPFRRTRETAEEMVKTIGKNIPILVDVGLRRHVPDWEKYKRKCYEDTNGHWTCEQWETERDFLKRIKEHHGATKHRHKQGDKIYWYITHGLYVRKIAAQKDICCQPEQIPSCGWINVCNGDHSLE